jgi:hypothetical protein
MFKFEHADLKELNNQSATLIIALEDAPPATGMTE